MFMKEIGKISITKSLYRTILKRTGISFLISRKMMLITPLTIFFWTWMDRLTSKYQLKLRTRPWIATAIYKSILVKNSLFRKYIKLKNQLKKIEEHDKYKHYKHLLSTVIKKSKKKKKILMNFLKSTWII